MLFLRKQMANDFIAALSKLDLEEPEEVEEESEEETEDRPEYEEEVELTREQQKIILRQQRYEARVAYRMKLREIRKEKKAEDREINREIRILERSKSRQIERERYVNIICPTLRLVVVLSTIEKMYIQYDLVRSTIVILGARSY